ncbi:acyl carrier protein [Streptomyces erythrogriseus]
MVRPVHHPQARGPADVRVPAAPVLAEPRAHRAHRAAARDGAAPAADDTLVPLSERIAGLGEEDARALVLDHVLERVAVVLGRSADQAVDPDEEVLKIGFDSMLSAELSKRLTASTGLRLRANMVLRHPTPA